MFNPSITITSSSEVYYPSPFFPEVPSSIEKETPPVQNVKIPLNRDIAFKKHKRIWSKKDLTLLKATIYNNQNAHGKIDWSKVAQDMMMHGRGNSITSWKARYQKIKANHYRQEKDA